MAAFKGQIPMPGAQMPGAMAQDIIRQWKTDPKIRSKFPDINAYSAWRQEEEANKRAG